MVDPLITLMGRILSHIPEGADYSLAVLKGHLIVEEELNNALSSKVSRPEDVEKARLSFKQLMLVTKAHYWAEDDSWCWAALNRLNKIRNSLSHNLEPDNFEDDLLKFVELVEQHQGLKEKVEFSERLRHALAMVAARVHGYWRSRNAL